MKKTGEPSLFDILGPIMIGPSSSHTAGASRIGFVARQLLDVEPTEAVITLYNSFARTHKGHGTDCAIIGGILGFEPDDERLKSSFELAWQKNLKWDFKFAGDAERFHSNAARIRLNGKSNDDSNRSIEVVGASLGGGRILIQEIEGFALEFNAQLDTLVIIAEDIKGSIQKISGVISESGLNIAQMSVSRNVTQSIPLASMVIELDQAPPNETVRAIGNLHWVKFSRLVPSMFSSSSRYEK
ncbi:MAG: L-serine ammonia-lyase, iron-sulfur-dependent subunit beta [Chloroherpetonaceae bacterium]|nr:L-serine ammonia-lyase, iron-sulfur-dependent subunit beta [Chloroherpetonaceae bacterium]